MPGHAELWHVSGVVVTRYSGSERCVPHSDAFRGSGGYRVALAEESFASATGGASAKTAAHNCVGHGRGVLTQTLVRRISL